MLCLASAALGPGTALADTASFTTAGCTIWPVPAGVASVSIEATGAAGSLKVGIPGPAPAGLGDTVSATLSGLAAGAQLHVCVDVGGGAGGHARSAFRAGGKGGGASGVSLGSDFTSPVLLAGGGGGQGGTGYGAGGNAGIPVAGDGGADTNGFGSAGGGSGGNNTLMTGGAGGSGSVDSGQSGAAFSATGPGAGGDGGREDVPGHFGVGSGGGGGGGGYFGGGGGGTTRSGDPDDPSSAGGGGGGSDFCSGLAALSPCTITAGGGTGTGAGSSPGSARVVLTYTVQHPPTPPAPDPQCPQLSSSAAGYIPTQSVPGRRVAGVRTRITASEPSRQQIHTTLRFRHAGRQRSVELGDRTLANPGTRNLRLPLPATLRDELPLGSRVTLELAITSTPDSMPGCSRPATTELSLRTRVVKVLPSQARSL